MIPITNIIPITINIDIVPITININIHPVRLLRVWVSECLTHANSQLQAVGILMSVEFDRESPGKFDSRTLNRTNISRWTGRSSSSSSSSSNNNIMILIIPITIHMIVIDYYQYEHNSDYYQYRHSSDYY